VLAIATGVCLLTGCGDSKQGTVPKHLDVRLPWHDGGRIPKEFTCDGANSTPVVGTLTKVDGMKQIAIVMIDPDAPGGTFTHWVRWGATDGKNSFGKLGYSGPCPPKGGKAHHYVLTLYGLKQPLTLPRGTGAQKALAAIKADAIASGRVTGVYGR